MPPKQYSRPGICSKKLRPIFTDASTKRNRHRRWELRRCLGWSLELIGDFPESNPFPVAGRSAPHVAKPAIRRNRQEKTRLIQLLARNSLNQLPSTGTMRAKSLLNQFLPPLQHLAAAFAGESDAKSHFTTDSDSSPWDEESITYRTARLGGPNCHW